MSINRAEITGNLTRDPELKAARSGTSILRFSVAVNDRRKNRQTGQWEDVPNFIDCVCFGARAQALANILRKGTKVAVEGKLRWSQWQDKDTGKNRSKVEVAVDDVDIMSGNKQAQPTPQYQNQQYQQPDPQPYPAPPMAASNLPY